MIEDLDRAFPVLRFAELGSTNAEAVRLAEGGEDGPVWIWAERQTSGRGRRGRVWRSGGGDLTASLLLTVSARPAEAALLSFAAALAAADLLEGAEPRAEVALKWPNDVLLDGRKAAGILIESGTRPDGRLWLVIGTGVNLVSAPTDADRPATALADHEPARSPADAGEALGRLDAALRRAMGVLREEGREALLALWRRRARGLSGPCEARLPTGVLSGRADGLDPDGALRLVLPGGEVRRITAGDVFFGDAASGGL